MSEYIVRETGYPGAIKQEIVGELVRCKDCRYYGHECVLLFPEDGYCYDGKRRDDERPDAVE